MRHVARLDELAPPYLSEPQTREAVKRFGQFLRAGGVGGKQGYLEVDGDEIIRRGADDLVRACRAQFDGKCAFTEMELPAGVDASTLHLFRPSQGARRERGDRAAARHYWWLVNSWSNLYPAIRELSSLKAQVFPVQGARMRLRGRKLDRPVLLDPCHDLPEWFLRFDANGEVDPAWNGWAPASVVEAGHADTYVDVMRLHRRRARASIRLYGLRSDAVQSSRRAALARWVPTGRGNVPVDIGAALARLDNFTPHLGAIRQVLAQHVLTSGEAPSADVVAELRPELSALAWTQFDAANTLENLVGKRKAAAIIAHGRALVPEFDSLGDPTGDAEFGYFDQLVGTPPRNLACAIKRISIKDFKAITKVDVVIDDAKMKLSEPNRFQRLYEDLAAQGGGDADTATDYAKEVVQTRVFIGENGSGKSSVLQAVALALASDEERHRLGVDLRDFIRWDVTEQGPKPNPRRKAVIEVELVSGTFTLTIKPNGDVQHVARTSDGEPVDTSGSSPWFLMRAYCATRTLKGEDSSREPLSIRNLFDPRVALVRPESWLLDIDDKQFGVVAATLQQLFAESNSDGSSLGVQGEMRRVPADAPTKVVVGNVELRHLSDGYRAVITLFCDIMAAAASLNPTDMRLAEGLVLIDEIGAHLHPRWRTKISSLIRREFAHMQVIVSTHEPLCMRGFLGGEVILVERDDDPTVGVRLTPIERNPTGLRVDQLLTSEFFGLYTTLDPEENDRLNLYYQLRAKKAQQPLADWEQDLLDRVQPLETEQVFGYSYREQLTYEAIDRYLTERRTRITPDQERERRAVAFKEVAEIWRAFERHAGDAGP